MKASFRVVAQQYPNEDTVMAVSLSLEQAIKSLEHLKEKYPEFFGWRVEAEYLFGD